METVPIDRLRLSDLHGRDVRLTDYCREYLLVIFLRHLAWLPCQNHLGEVHSLKADLDRRGVTVVVISFAEPERLVHYQEYHNWPFVLLADPKRVAYKSFNLKQLSWFRVFSLPTLRLYLRLLREGKKIQNYGRDDYYQAGGDFLLDCNGTILLAHRSKDPSDRLGVLRLLEEIDRIKNIAPRTQ